MFQVGDKVVHPMHGAGIVDSIVQEKVNGAMEDYYLLKLPNRSMVVMVPVKTSSEVGLRPVVPQERADEVLSSIPTIEVEMIANWNKRYRDNLERLKSGDLMEVARVIKGLTIRDGKRGLSTGERKMLNSARDILISEVVMAKDMSEEDATAALDAALA